MARMTRKQIVLDDESEALLERMAKDRGVSQSQVVREALALLGRNFVDAATRKEARARLMERFENAEPLGLTGPDGRLLWDRDARNSRR